MPDKPANLPPPKKKTARKIFCCGGFLPQFWALMSRNFLLKVRSFLRTFSELLFVLLFIILGQIFKKDGVDQAMNAVDFPVYPLFNAKPKKFTLNNEQPFQFTTQKDSRQFFVVQNGISSTRVKRMTRRIFKDLGIHQRAESQILANNEKLVEIYRRIYKFNIAGAIVFEGEDTDYVPYPMKIRTPKYAIRMPGPGLVLQVPKKGPRADFQAIASSYLETRYCYQPLLKGLSSNCPPNDYLLSGYAQLQMVVESAILEELTRGSDPPVISGLRLNYSVKMFPVPRLTYTPDGRPAVGAAGQYHLLGVAAALGLIPFYVSLVVQLVSEKESKIKDMMRVMGMLESAFWLSYLVVNAFEALILSCLMLIMVVGSDWIVGNIEWSVFFILFWIYSLTVISQSFVVSVLFKSVKSAAVFSIISAFFFALATPILMFVMMLIPFAVACIFAIVPQVAICLALTHCVWLAAVERSVTWDLINEEVELPTKRDDGTSLYWTFTAQLGLIFLSVEFIAFFAIAVYLEHFFPTVYGNRLQRNPCFFCTPHYWSCCQNRRRELPNIEADDATNADLVSEVVEPVPKSLDGKIALKIRHLRKAYGSNPPVVESVSMNVYEDQITCILGPNGAGKTTTINMLIGLVRPTGGTARLYGNDITDPFGMTAIRGMTGICPQHDIIFDNLTCKEHLVLFSRFQGIRNIKNEVEKRLKQVLLWEKKDTVTRKLSGGQKRKLSVAIALTGNPKMVLFDEPTAGLDPFSRRALWDLLKEEKQGKVIILTTHFMDEADILADRKAILINGYLQCMGSSMFLKNKFGLGYHLNLVTKGSVNVDKIANFVMNYLPSATLGRLHGQEIIFTLPRESAAQFPLLFASLEDPATLADLGIENYGISMTSLDEVFLKMIDELGAVSMEDQMEKSDSDSPSLQAKTKSKIDLSTLNLLPKAGQKRRGAKLPKMGKVTQPGPKLTFQKLNAMFNIKFKTMVKQKASAVMIFLFPGLYLMLMMFIQSPVFLGYISGVMYSHQTSCQAGVTCLPTNPTVYGTNLSLYVNEKRLKDKSFLFTLQRQTFEKKIVRLLPKQLELNAKVAAYLGAINQMHVKKPQLYPFLPDQVMTLYPFLWDTSECRHCERLLGMIGMPKTPLPKKRPKKRPKKSPKKGTEKPTSSSTSSPPPSTTPSTPSPRPPPRLPSPPRRSPLSEWPHQWPLYNIRFSNRNIFDDRSLYFEEFKQYYMAFTNTYKRMSEKKTYKYGEKKYSLKEGFGKAFKTFKMFPMGLKVRKFDPFARPVSKYNTDLTIYYHPVGTLAVPAVINYVSNLIASTVNASIVGFSYPFPMDLSPMVFTQEFEYISFIPLPSIICSEEVLMRTSGLRSQLALMGISRSMYWFVSIVVHLVIAFINVLFAIITIYIMRFEFLSTVIGYCILELCMVQLLSILVAYILSFALDKPQPFMTFVVILIAYAAPIETMKFVNDGTRPKQTVDIIKIVFMILDPFYGGVIAFSALAGSGDDDLFIIANMTTVFWILLDLLLLPIIDYLKTGGTCSSLNDVVLRRKPSWEKAEKNIGEERSEQITNYETEQDEDDDDDDYYVDGKNEERKNSNSNNINDDNVYNNNNDDNVYNNNSNNDDKDDNNDDKELKVKILPGSSRVNANAGRKLQFADNLETFPRRSLRSGDNKNAEQNPNTLSVKDAAKGASKLSIRSSMDMGRGIDPDVEAERRYVEALDLRADSKTLPVVIVKNLKKYFRRRKMLKVVEVKKAVDQMDFCVRRGEVFGLLGPNGAGKSTTQNIIIGSTPPSSGTVIVGGHPITTSKARALEAMGYVPQFDALFDNFGVEEQIVDFALVRGIPKSEAKYLARKITEALRITKNADTPAKSLSGGTRRKLSLAIAMLGEPQVLLLDEPSTGMDSASKRVLWDLIHNACSGKHRGAILTTHAMEEADALCSRIGIVMRGRLRTIGTSQHLKQKHGSGYILEVKLHRPKEEDEKVIKDREVAFLALTESLYGDNFEVRENFDGRIILKIPQHAVKSLAEIFEALERNKEAVGIEEYQFSQCTLEQVFLELVAEQEQGAGVL